MAAPFLLACLKMFTDPQWGTLRLSGGLDHATIVSRLHQAKAYRSSIHSLSCYRIDFTDLLTELIVGLLLAPRGGNPSKGDQRKIDYQWKTIELHSCSGSGVYVLIETICTCSIDKLVIRGMNFSAEGLGYAISRGLKARSLVTTREKFIDTKPLSSGSILELHLGVSVSTPNALLSLCDGLARVNSLRVVNLSGSRWHSIAGSIARRCAMNDLVKVLQVASSVQDLSLADCRLGDADLCCFVPLIASHPGFVNIDLTGNSCSSKFLSEMAKHMLSEPSGEKPSSLPKISLAHDILSEDRVAGLDVFFKALSKPSIKIESLFLTSYMITEPDLIILAESLANTSCPVRRLSIRTCGVTTRGVQELVRRLPQVLNLSELALPDISSPIDLLLPGVSGNYSLTCLEIGDNPNMTKPIDPLSYYIDMNRGGRRLLSGKGGRSDILLWPNVLARAGRVEYINSTHAVDAVYCLLRGKILVEQIQ